MPTLEQFNELITVCDAQLKTDYEGTGINGYIFKSRKNGNSIILPSPGYINNFDLTDANTTGRYWTCIRYSDNPNVAACLFVVSSPEYHEARMSGCVLGCGSCVRVVSR